MRTQNMTGRTGRAVPNQFIITDDNGNQFFQSYKTIIARIDAGGKTTLDSTYWNYSTTTSKYLAAFLGMNSKEIKQNIAAGNFEFASLNPADHSAR